MGVLEKIKRFFKKDVYVSHLGSRMTNMKRSNIINSLITKNKYQTYLEIGVRKPSDNFNKIKISKKDGVDPAGNCNYPVTSDAFFASLDFSIKYDIIFIDGLHTEKQVDKDIANSLNHLNSGGTIVMHDCNPPHLINQVEEYDGKSPWNGTTWKSFAKLRMSNHNLLMYVVDTDWGVGVIQKGNQQLFTKADPLNFEYLEKNRVGLMNLISPEDFLKQVS